MYWRTTWVPSTLHTTYYILHTTPPLICSLQYTFVSGKSNSEYIGFSTQSWTCIDFLLARSIFIIILIQRPGDLFILLICISGPQARALAEFFRFFRFSNGSLMSVLLMRLFFKKKTPNMENLLTCSPSCIVKISWALAVRKGPLVSVVRKKSAQIFISRIQADIHLRDFSDL